MDNERIFSGDNPLINLKFVQAVDTEDSMIYSTITFVLSTDSSKAFWKFKSKEERDRVFQTIKEKYFEEI